MVEPDDPFAHTRMSLGEHLDELRTRLIRGIVTVVLCFVGSLFFREQVQALVLRPHRETVDTVNAEFERRARELIAEHPEREEEFFEPDGTFRHPMSERLQVFSPTEALWFSLKVCGYFALFVGSPFLLWQLWGFVAAGLYDRERRWVRVFFPPALVLFFAGVLFSYGMLVPYGLRYLYGDASIELLEPNIRLEYYFSFLGTLCLGMGLIFQLPVLMTFSGTVGLVEPATFTRVRGYFVIAAFVIAALLTPGPDVYSQLAMALPMLGLYEIGILGARLGRRRRADGGSEVLSGS
jgi:sec-independent protein translocase protein TatC